MRIATSLISVEQARHNLALEISAADTLEAWPAVRRMGRAPGPFRHRQRQRRPEDHAVAPACTGCTCTNSGHENVGSAALHDWLRQPGQRQRDAFDGSATRSYAAVRDGKVFVNNGFWDTFRTTWPAYALFAPDDAGQLVQGYIEQYRAAAGSRAGRRRAAPTEWSAPAPDVASPMPLKGIGGFGGRGLRRPR